MTRDSRTRTWIYGRLTRRLIRRVGGGRHGYSSVGGGMHERGHPTTVLKPDSRRLHLRFGAAPGEAV